MAEDADTRPTGSPPSATDLGPAAQGPPPKLTGKQAAILSVLAPDAVHAMADVADAIGTTANNLNRSVTALSALGLVTSFRLGPPLYVGITPEGAAHPDRKESGAPVRGADVSNGFGPRRIAFLETLSVLGEARTLEVTAALAGEDRSGKALMSGQTVAAMLRSEFVEPVGRDEGDRPVYRLTAAGRLVAMLLARTRPPPRREEIEARAAAYLHRQAQHRRSKAADAHSREGAFSPAQAAILEALEKGPLTTSALTAIALRFVGNPRSTGRMLRTLEQRGIVRRIALGGRSSSWERVGSMIGRA